MFQVICFLSAESLRVYSRSVILQKCDVMTRKRVRTRTTFSIKDTLLFKKLSIKSSLCIAKRHTAVQSNQSSQKNEIQKGRYMDQQESAPTSKMMVVQSRDYAATHVG
jgi:hypothetical protein